MNQVDRGARAVRATLHRLSHGLVAVVLLATSLAGGVGLAILGAASTATPASAAITPSIVHYQVETNNMISDIDNGGRTVSANLGFVRATFIVQHDPGLTVNQARVSNNTAATALPSTYSALPSGTVVNTISAGSTYDEVQLAIPASGNFASISCGGTRTSQPTAAVQFKLSDGTVVGSGPTSWTFNTGSDYDCSGGDNRAMAYDDTSTINGQLANMSSTFTVGYKCNDVQSGGCDYANLRVRRVSDNSTFQLQCTATMNNTNNGCETGSGHVAIANLPAFDFNGDNGVARSYTFNPPAAAGRGRFIIEGQFCNPGTSSTCPGTLGWQWLGSYNVNDAAPTLSLSGSSTAGTFARPNTGATVTATATPSADAQILQWDLNQNTTDGTNGYEVREYGTVAYPVANPVGSFTSGQTAKSVNTASLGDGVSCGVRALATDTGGINGADVTRLDSSAQTLACTTNRKPSGTATSFNAQRGQSTNFTLAGTDNDGFTVNSSGDESNLTIALGSLNSGDGSATCGSFVNLLPGSKSGTFSCTYNAPTGVALPKTVTLPYTVTDAHAGTSTSVNATITLTDTAPTANPLAHDAQRGALTTFNLQGADANGDGLTYSLNSQPNAGSVSCTTAGACTYAAPPDLSTATSQTFSWKVCETPAPSSCSANVTEQLNIKNTAPTAVGATTPVQRGVSTNFNLNGSDPANSDTLTYSVVTNPSIGSLSCGTNGACTYSVPADTALSNPTFTWKVCDPNPTTCSSNATGTIQIGNTAPVANNVGTLHVVVGANVAATLNGTDANGDTLTYTAPIIGPGKGGVSGTGANRTYTPNSGTKGTDSFTYTVADNLAPGAAPGTVSIVIDNSAPTANAQTPSAPRGIATPITLSGSDVNNDALTFAVQSTTTKGNLSCAGASCSYTAGPGQTGTDSFTYVANDNTVNSAPATVTITITNSQPTADSPSVSAQRGVATSITLTGSDPNGDPLTYAAPVTGPSKGSVSCTGASCSYTAAAGQTGTDSFTFTVSDGFGGSATGTVTITILNTPPTANNQSLTAQRGVARSITLTGADLNGDALTYTAPASGPSKGSLSCTGASCSYTAGPGTSGADSFTFTVADGFGGTATGTVDLTIGNDAPSADAQSLSAHRGIALPITLTGSDPNGDPITFAVAGGPTKGSLVCTGASCSYTAGAGQTGSDSFTYVANDGSLDSAPATVSLTITNDDPVADAQSVAAQRGQAKAITLTGSDPNGDPLTYTAPVTGPTKGTLDCTGASCSYTAGAGQSGSDSFTFTVTDGFGGSGTATVDITIGNVPPVADPQSVSAQRGVATPITLTASDGNGDTLAYTAPVSGPSKGSVTCIGASCSYTAGAGQTGSDSFTFSVSDGFGGTDTATISIGIGNTAPTADAKSVSAPRGVATPVTLSGSDTNGDPLTFSVTGGPSKGSLDCTGASCSYTAGPGQSGTDSFTYVANDGYADSAAATVTITITNQGPSANNQTIYAAAPGTGTPVTLTGSDPNGDPLTYAVLASPTKGTASCTANACTYTANSGQTGNDSFTFTTADGFGGTATGTVTVVLNGGLSGTVTDVITHLPISGANVRLWSVSNPGITSTADRTTTTDAAGRYSFADVVPGDYQVQFAKTGSYLAGWYTNAPNRLGATTITIGAGGNIEASQAMASTRSVTGTITDRTTGLPINGARIMVYKHGSTYNGLNTYTDATGAYSFSSLPTGTFDLLVVKVGYLDMWFDGSPDQANATAISVTTTNAPVADFALATDPASQAAVQGTLRDQATGLPIANAQVRLWKHFTETYIAVQTDANGHYIMNSVPPGIYQLQFARSGYATKWYPTAAVRGNATDITLQTTTSVIYDVNLSR